MTEHTVGGRAQGKTLEVLKATRERAVALDKMLKVEQERAEMLEVLLFAFVWNRTTYPMGKSLGKTEDEILLKTLEVINAGMKMVEFEKARERLVRARKLMEERSGDADGEQSAE